MRACAWGAVVLALLVQGAFSRRISDDVPEERSIAGKYVVFGWAPESDFVTDYPAYVGLATIEQFGSTWHLEQSKGQKVYGAAKEESISVGNAVGSIVTFGWSHADDGDENGISSHRYGCAEYSVVDENTLAGPYTEYGSGAVGFEQLVRLEATDGYYVDLQTDLQRKLRENVLSLYASPKGTSEAYYFQDWVSEANVLQEPSHTGSVTVEVLGDTVDVTYVFSEDASLRAASGLLRYNDGISLGWWNVDGDWGSIHLKWTGGVLQGSWTMFGSPQVGYEQLFREPARG